MLLRPFLAAWLCENIFLILVIKTLINKKKAGITRVSVRISIVAVVVCDMFIDHNPPQKT